MDPPFPERAGKLLSLVSSIPRPIGRFSVVLLFGVLRLTLGGTANAVRAANNKLFVFHGNIRAVDAATRAFTLQTDKQSYVFVVTDQTKIARNGKARNFSDLKQGQFAEVEMKIGPGGKGMAVSVRVGFYTSRQLDFRIRQLQFQSLFAATTPSGKTIFGTELSSLVVHWPVFYPIAGAGRFGPLKLGVFLLSIRRDGTVSNVEMLHSIGYNELDKFATIWMTKLRFRPNSVVQVRVPMALVHQRY